MTMTPSVADYRATSPEDGGGEGQRRLRLSFPLPRLRGRWRVLRDGGGLLALLLALLTLPALAVEPSEMLKDPALEARARDIGRGLRCVVCQNQSIDDSSAEVAHDMRRAVRERLSAGDSDRQVYDFMVARYGDYVLLEPPFKSATLILWLGAPLLLLLAGGLLLLAARRRRVIAETAPLSAAERARLDSLLGPRASRPAHDREAGLEARGPKDA